MSPRPPETDCERFSNEDNPIPPPNSPSVHIIVLDSVSTSQFIRSMPLTLNYLRTEMDVILFPRMLNLFAQLADLHYMQMSTKLVSVL